MFRNQKAQIDLKTKFNIVHRGRLSFESSSLIDQDNDPRLHFDDDQNAMRKALGDICFMQRVDRYGRYKLVYFCPEYPSESLGEYSAASSYYAVGLSDRHDEYIEIRDDAPDVKVLDWEDGMKHISELDASQLSEFQRSFIDFALQIDVLPEPQMPKEEMRQIVGRPVGSRICLTHLIYGNY